MFSPSSFATRLRFLKEILPVSSSSNRRNAFMISSRESRSPILAVIICRNSSKSMVPEPSLSMSEIIFLISSFLGSKPSARMATFSSLASMVPEPSVSNRSNASRISCFCSSVRPEERPLPLSRRAEPTACDGSRSRGGARGGVSGGFEARRAKKNKGARSNREKLSSTDVPVATGPLSGDRRNCAKFHCDER